MAAAVPNVRRRQAVALCAAALSGMAYAAVLLIGLDTAYAPPPVPPAPVRVTFDEAPRPMLDAQLAETLAQVPINTPAPDWEAQPPPVLALEQEPVRQAQAPQHPVHVRHPNQELSEIEEPPLPQNIPLDAPGGDVTVIAVLVDAQGFVRSTKILVTSADPIADMNHLLNLPARVNPPANLSEGAAHWVHLRFRKDALELP